MQEVQPSLEKSVHLYWSGEGSSESALPGAKHVDPLLQMAQKHQPTPPDKGFLGTWSGLGGQARGGVLVGQPVTALTGMSAWDANGRRLQQGMGCSGWVLLWCLYPVVPSMCPSDLICPGVLGAVT